MRLGPRACVLPNVFDNFCPAWLPETIRHFQSFSTSTEATAWVSSEVKDERRAGDIDAEEIEGAKGFELVIL